MIVLDTNVLSELMRAAPATKVVRWVSGQASSRLFTTSITQAEIWHGVLLLPKGRRREALEAAVAAIFQDDFSGRVLPFDSDAAHPYASIARDRQRLGHPISHFDAQIAAIARSVGAALATRNTTDFEDCGVGLIDPWSA